MTAARGIRWGRISAAAFLTETSVFVLLAPVYFLLGVNAAMYSTTWASFVAAFLLALWVCRPLDARFLLHGFLVGLAAMLLYEVVNFVAKAPPEPWYYYLAHALKLLGGVAGGFVAERRRRPAASSSSSVSVSLSEV